MRGLQERGAVAALTPGTPGGPPGPAPPAGAPAGHRHVARLLTTLGVAAVVVAADQVTKTAAEDHVRVPTHVFGPLGLGLGFNTGSAFSFFTGRAPVLGAVAVVLVCALVVLAWRARSAGLAVALGLMLGGALGNLSDRVFRGHHGAVVDWLTLPHWPTFNLADASIVAGAVLVVLLQFLRRPERERSGALERSP